MDIVIAITVVVVAPLLLLAVTSTAVLWSNYKSYKKVYNSLPGRKFYRNDTQIYSHSFRSPGDGFVWYLNGNDFNLSNDHFLYAAPFTWFDPYSAYWLVKYRLWFKRNVDIDKIEKY